MKKSALLLILTALMLTSAVSAEETKAPPMKVVIVSGEDGDDSAEDTAIAEDAQLTEENWEDAAEREELEAVTNAPTYANFIKSRTYAAGTFADVKDSDWFAGNVKTAYEYGLMNGKTADTFDPAGSITVAETITLAARIHAIHTTGKLDGFETTTPWYQTYVDYAMENGMLDGDGYVMTEPATRAQFAGILARALPTDEMHVANPVEVIPDVGAEDRYAEEIYTLYRAGILTGSDASGAFNPMNNVKRSEAATVITRMIETGKSLLAEDAVMVIPDDSTPGTKVLG